MNRRRALVTIGGFAGLALGAAPFAMADATLDVEIHVLDYELVEDVSDAGEAEFLVDAVTLELSNGPGEPLIPLFFTWDQKRKTRHNWDVDVGPDRLEAGEGATYRIVAPSDEGRMHAGYPTQLTVFQKNEQHWRSVHLVPGEEAAR